MMKLAACSIVFASMSLLAGCATAAQDSEVGEESEASEALVSAAQACDDFNKCIQDSSEGYDPRVDKSVSKYLGAICKRAISTASKGVILGKCVEGTPGFEGAGLSCWESANPLKCKLPKPKTTRQAACLKLGGDIGCFVKK